MALSVGTPEAPLGVARNRFWDALAKAMLMFPELLIGVLVMLNNVPVWVRPRLVTVPGFTLASTNWSVATLVEVSPALWVVAVVPFARPALTLHVPPFTCATPVLALVFSPVPP